MKKSGGCGFVRARSRGKGAVGQTRADRRQGETRAQTQAILDDHAELLRTALDGDAERTAAGYHAETVGRVLFVPHTKAKDAAVAILLCRQGGIVREKLAAMDDATAAFTYATTLPRNVIDN